MATIDKLQRKMIFLLPIISCFDAYCITYIENFPITLSFISIFFILALSIFNVKTKIKLYNLILFVLFLLALLVSMIGNDVDINSTCLYLFFFVAYLFINNNLTDLEMFKGLKCFLFVINILAAIAIIQFLSNFINIPRLEIVLSNHMVEGFNTGNYVYISNFVIMRSHSIFLEPSILSQYSAFAIVISLILYSYKIINKHFLISSLFLNSIAIICSISGTGLIILVLSIIIYFLKNFKYKKTKKYILIFLIVLTIIITVLPINIKKYIITRALEVLNPQLSGGMRFSYPYIIMFKSWLFRPFGFSPGNEAAAILKFQPSMLELQSTLASGYAKLGVELGIFGLLIFLLMILSNTRKKNIYLITFLLLINFLGGNLLQTYFWIFAIFLKNINYSCNAVGRKTIINLNKDGGAA